MGPFGGGWETKHDIAKDIAILVNESQLPVLKNESGRLIFRMVEIIYSRAAACKSTDRKWQSQNKNQNNTNNFFQWN